MPNDDPAALYDLARQALANGDEESALSRVAEAARRAVGDARLWQWTGLLHRALDQHAQALVAFDRAVSLAGQDHSIVYGRALTAMEAGIEAASLFGAAAALDPSNGDTVLGLSAARFAAGDGAAAADDLAALLVNNPGWIPGHAGLARLHAMLGREDAATASLEAALAAQPQNPSLWDALVVTLFTGRRFAEAREAIGRARAALGEGVFAAYEAVIASELGDAGADALLAAIDAPNDLPFAIHRIRQLLRTGRAAQALPIVDHWIAVPGANAIWPYAALVWRATGDARWDWLEGDARLISVTDLATSLPLDRLADVLRGMHVAQGQPFDQSVRGGTQTDGILFTRIAPEIVALRATIVEAVRAHIAQLPPPDPSHPILGVPRDRPIRFSGAWSVRLTGGGHHSSHIHPLGWLSSALYVSLPEAEAAPAGWLSLGESPPDLGLNLPPLRRIEPKPGQLVLFPSTLWHATVPFAAGERLTVGIDVARPR